MFFIVWSKVCEFYLCQFAVCSSKLGQNLQICFRKSVLEICPAFPCSLLLYALRNTAQIFAIIVRHWHTNQWRNMLYRLLILFIFLICSVCLIKGQYSLISFFASKVEQMCFFNYHYELQALHFFKSGMTVETSIWVSKFKFFPLFSKYKQPVLIISIVN